MSVKHWPVVFLSLYNVSYLSLLMIVALIIIIVAKKLVFVIRSVKHCLLDRITLINMIVEKLK